MGCRPRRFAGHGAGFGSGRGVCPPLHATHLPGFIITRGRRSVSAIRQLQDALEKNDIPLRLVRRQTSTWCRISLRACAQAGSFACGSRYILIEPPHHTRARPTRILLFQQLVRDSWRSSRSQNPKTGFRIATSRFAIVRAGVWIKSPQFATGAFGRHAQYWAHRMLDEGCVHIPGYGCS